MKHSTRKEQKPPKAYLKKVNIIRGKQAGGPASEIIFFCYILNTITMRHFTHVGFTLYQKCHMMSHDFNI